MTLYALQTIRGLQILLFIRNNSLVILKLQTDLIFRLPHHKPKAIAAETNINLEATIMEMKIYIYMAHIYPVWIEPSGVMLSHGPLLALMKAKPTE